MADATSFALSAAGVLWLLTPAYVANAFATLPKGRGPPMDFGRNWPWDGRRILGPSKTWSGFLFGTFGALPVGLFMAYLILIAPPEYAIVPQFASTVAGAVPVILLLTGGALAGDALGSFVKRRLNKGSGERVLLLDQLPFVVVPVLLGFAFYPELFVPVFFSLAGLFWLLVFTLGLHTLFNWVGYRVGTKRVPW